MNDNFKILQESINKVVNIPEGAREKKRPYSQSSSPYQYRAINTTGVALLKGNIVAVTGFDTSLNMYEITKPTGESSDIIAVILTPSKIGTEETPGEIVRLSFSGGVDLLLSDTTTEDIKTAGPVANSVLASFESSNIVFNVFGQSKDADTDLYKGVFIGGGGGSSIIPALITSGSALSGYTCTLYENGVDEANTGTATGVKALDMAIADSAAIGEYVMMFSGTFAITGGEDVD